MKPATAGGKLQILNLRVTPEGEPEIDGVKVPKNETQTFASGGNYTFVVDAATQQLNVVTSEEGQEGVEPKTRAFILIPGRSYTLSLRSCRRPANHGQPSHGPSVKLDLANLSNESKIVVLTALAKHRGRRRRK